MAGADMSDKQLSLRRKLTITTFIMGGIISIFASMMFALTIRSMTRETITKTFYSLKDEIGQSISQSIDSIDNTAHNLIQSGSVYEYISGDVDSTTLDELEIFTLKNELEKDISRQLNFNPAFESGLLETIRLHLDEQNVVFRSRVSTELDHIVSSTSNIYQSVVASQTIGRSFYGLDSKEKPLIFAYNLSSPSTVTQPTVLLLGTNKQTLFDHYTPLLDNFPSSLFLLETKKGEVLLANGDITTIKTLVGQAASKSVRIDGKPFRVETNPIANGTFLSTILVSERELGGNISTQLARFLFYFLVLIILLLFGSYLFFSKFNVFTKDFIRHIQKVGNGDFSGIIPSYGDTDLDQIGEAFNTMSKKINSLIEGVYKKQLLIQQMDIRLLQSQMNPHFLFNVLFSISTRAKIIGDEILYEMSSKLSTLLQSSLTTKNQNKIQLKMELEYVFSYLKIQQIRFGDRLDYELVLQDDRVLALYCPRLCLQPLVENAVIHGIEPSSQTGHIKIEIFIEKEGLLTLRVEDNGVGFDPAKKAECGESHSNHIAIQNLSERIRLLYGPGYGLELHSAPGLGCTAIIRIPVENQSS